jgi:heme-degrading monooxygenase HmoA
MFTAIFEILPKRERFEDYLTLAKQLRPLLQKMDGFVDNERFESQTRRGWILSVSTWRDEKSVIRWRTTGEHHRIQQKGRLDSRPPRRLALPSRCHSIGRADEVIE